jgi:hypothetical protein
MQNHPVPTGRAADLEDGEISRLRRRQDAVFRELHSLTRRRDLGTVRFEESVGVEALLVIELGQIQDRLNRLGAHSYDGCSLCRPAGGDPPLKPSWRT